MPETAMQLITLEKRAENQLITFTSQYQQFLMLYESGVRQITAKLEILSRAYEVQGRKNPIETIKSRIKSLQSILEKMHRKGFEITYQSMAAHLHDIAGVRVICPYISDIYAVRDALLRQPDIKLIREKDYISHPKKNGYRSLHLVVEIPIYFSDCMYPVKVEIQIRTMAMDFWSSLEHELRYKSKNAMPESISQELLSCANTIADTDRKMQELFEQMEHIS